MAETTFYNQVFYYLRDNQYPEGCTKDQKRNLRKKAQKFILDDGALFFVANENSPPKRWVHNKEEQERVLHACHSVLLVLLNRTLVFKGVQIRERGSISASGFGPGGPNPRGV